MVDAANDDDWLMASIKVDDAMLCRSSDPTGVITKIMLDATLKMIEVFYERHPERKPN